MSKAHLHSLRLHCNAHPAHQQTVALITQQCGRTLQNDARVSCPRAVPPNLPPFLPALPTGPQWVVQCHVHPKWEYYEPGMEAAAKPMSPHYLLKLKKGGVVALVGDSLVGRDDLPACRAGVMAPFVKRWILKL